MAQTIPPALEDKIRKYETQRRIYESFKTQLHVTQQELSELAMTLKELEKYPEDAVTYKAVGSIMFQVEKAQLTANLQEREGDLKRRTETTNRKTSELENKLTEMKDEITNELSKLNPTLQ